MAEDIFKETLLKLALIRKCDAFQPHKLASQPKLCTQKFPRVLEKLEGCESVEESECDRAFHPFLQTVVERENSSFKNFSHEGRD